MLCPCEGYTRHERIKMRCHPGEQNPYHIPTVTVMKVHKIDKVLSEDSLEQSHLSQLF